MAEWLVDGNNLMGSRPDGWWRDRTGARRRLVGELAGLVKRTGDRVTVVFDGPWQPDEVAEGQAQEITVLFAPGGPNAADRVIADLTRSHPEPSTVVTSDRALATEVDRAGATVLGVSAFRRLLS